MPAYLQLVYPGIGNHRADCILLGKDAQYILISLGNSQGLAMVDVVQDQNRGSGQLGDHPGDVRKTRPLDDGAGEHLIDLEGAAQQGGLPAQQLVGDALGQLGELYRGGQLQQGQAIGVGLLHHEGRDFLEVLSRLDTDGGDPLFRQIGEKGPHRLRIVVDGIAGGGHQLPLAEPFVILRGIAQVDALHSPVQARASAQQPGAVEHWKADDLGHLRKV